MHCLCRCLVLREYASPVGSIPLQLSFVPARDLIAGKSVLADINAQYGIGIVYLTALLWLVDVTDDRSVLQWHAEHP